GGRDRGGLPPPAPDAAARARASAAGRAVPAAWEVAVWAAVAWVWAWEWGWVHAGWATTAEAWSGRREIVKIDAPCLLTLLTTSCNGRPNPVRVCLRRSFRVLSDNRSARKMDNQSTG